MVLDSKKLEKFGIVIDDSHEPSVAYISHDVTQCTLHDIRLAFKGQIKFEKITSNFTSNKNTSEQNNLDIFTEVDQYISETEFIRSAEIALSANDENDAPIVKLFNTLLSAAISKSASDLHIDPVDDRLLIRMRIDGVMTKFTDLDQRVAQMIIARIKLVSNLDITEKRLPQDGRLNVRFKGNSIDIRVATLPTKSGERVVLRFFSNQLTHAEVHDTSLHKTHINSLLSAIANQSGLILVCGPTGSGKTTTIYSLLNTLVGRGLNIMTVEDPVEVQIPHIIQTQVNESVGFNFAKGLRSLLRNDPDVILIGEIRDVDTAEIAVRAAMTGHLVISTVHANTPVSALKRLSNLNVDLSLLADCLLGVYSQRLVRLYCKDCQKDSVQSTSHQSVLPAFFKGCTSCNNTGFKGRVPVMSHLEMNSENARLLEEDIPKLVIEDTLEREALRLYRDGLTSLFEINRLKQHF